MAVKVNPNLVEVRYSPATNIPREWGTPKQRQNILESLKRWAGDAGCVSVAIYNMCFASDYGFKEKKVLRVHFLTRNQGESWDYSITEKGLCKNHGQRVLGPNIEPPLLYKWADFENGTLTKPERPRLPKPQV